MDRSTNAARDSISAYQLPARDLENTGEAKPIRSADPTMSKNRASVASFDTNPYEMGAPPKFNVLRGSWRWDIRTDTTLWSAELYRIIGRENTTIPPFREHFRFYTSESWIRLVDATLELLKTGTPYELRLEMLHSDGSRRWVIRNGEPVDNERGEIVALRGTVQALAGWVSQVGEAERSFEAESNADDATRRLIQAQEEENARLVIKFRDNICKRLALLAATIESFRSTFPDLSPQSESQLEPDTQTEPLWQETAEILADLDLPKPSATVTSDFTD
jgi:PAS fold